MAIAIKSIPVLENEAALYFESKISENQANAGSIDFSKEYAIAEEILSKVNFQCLNFISNKCTFSQYNSSLISRCNDFDCSHEDLNDFFVNDTSDWHEQLLGKTYCFTLDENPETIVCAFSVSNDSIKKHLLPRARERVY